MKQLLVVVFALSVVGCATLTEDAMTPIAFSFSDGSSGTCKLVNKRGAWEQEIPGIASVRKSDDALKYDCATEDGRIAVGSIESEMGAKIVASAVFLDFGITDAITDKHRKYVESYVIPIKALEGVSPKSASSGKASEGTGKSAMYTKLEELEQLRQDGIITDEEFEAQKKKILDSD
jgi:Short C-terminal domain